MVCIKCGYKNLDTANYCKRCNALLPKLSAGYKPPPPQKVTGRFNRFKDAIGNVKNKKWSADEFKKFLDEISKNLYSRGQEIRNVEIPSEIMSEFEEELSIGLEGINLFEGGMKELSLYLEDKKEEHLDKGLKLIEEGNNKINEAMIINRENREKLEEMYDAAGGEAPMV